MSLTDEVLPQADGQLVLDQRAFPFTPLRAFAKEGALTVTSLDLSVGEDISFATYERLGTYLGLMNRASVWWIGDWLLYGEGRYEDRWPQALAATGLTEETLRMRMAVCEAVPPERRFAGLGFSLHHAVHRLPPGEQLRWLRKAEKQGWGLGALKAAMADANREPTEPMFDGDDPPPRPRAEDVLEVARAILRDARPAEDSAYYLIPADDVARLRAAVEGE